jgi:hypothetical protein
MLGLLDFGGCERIRTAVQGFADLCLATRPRNPLFWSAKIGIFCLFPIANPKKYLHFYRSRLRYILIAIQLRVILIGHSVGTELGGDIFYGLLCDLPPLLGLVVV